MALGAALLAPRVASAQTLADRLTLRGEAGIGSMLSQFQTSTLDQHIDLEGTLRLGFTVAEPLVVQASFGSWFFPSNNSGQIYSFTLGLRAEPRVGTLGRAFLDVNAGLGQTDTLSRVTFDVGIGFEFAVLPFLGIGPFARYGHVFHADADAPFDAQYFAVGVSVALRFPAATPAPVVLPPPPADADGDGVLDVDDLCPQVPAGAHPDPAHRGCPTRDGDGDGVPDADDLCPAQPAGEHPDPARLGCPEGDSDNDGVFDHADQCPTTPAGAHPDPERAGCPEGDDDADGVLNHEDQCRTQPAGLHPDPARPGCPLPDRDSDSVPDATDHCPDQPGAPSPDPNRNGCPGLVRIENGVLRILQPVFFATNSDRILPRSTGVLQAVADALGATPEVHRMSIDGHTDDVGDDTRNMDLSQRRAQSVQRWLVEHGIDAGRLEAHGYGETHPLEPVTAQQRPREQRAHRAANRRVEFHILDPATGPSSTTTTTTPPSSP